MKKPWLIKALLIGLAVLFFSCFLLFMASLRGCPYPEVENEITRVAMRQVKNALAAYFNKKGEYPSSKDGLQKLLDEKIIREMPRDIWGEPLHYAHPGQYRQQYDLWSNGKDRLPGGGDDINSWDE